MKRRTILPCWCVRLVAGGETHEVIQTGICNWEKAEARIRRYFIAERQQIVEKFLSMERMSEQEAKAWLEVAERRDASRGRVSSPRGKRDVLSVVAFKMKTPARACCWTEDGESICCLPIGHKGEHDFTRQCNHTDQPTGYREWHQWAKKKSKTHRQYKCPHCGLWAIWMEKPKKNAGSAASTRRTTKASAKAVSPTGTTQPRSSRGGCNAGILHKSPTNVRYFRHKSEQDAHWAYITG